MVYLPEERVALWPWATECCEKSAITADDLHFWVEEPGAPQADLAEFLHTAFFTVAYTATAFSAYAVAASQTQQVDADLQCALQLQESCRDGHEESAQCSAVPAAQTSENNATESRWADFEDSESEDGPSSSEQKPLEEELGQIQEKKCSDAHRAARTGLGDGESQVDSSQSLPFVEAVFDSKSEPLDIGKVFRPRWGDIDDSESEDQTVEGPHFSQHKLLENEGLRIQGECNSGDQQAETTELPEQRRSKGSATRGKRGGVKRNAGRHAAQSVANWDAASQRPNKSWDASSSWQKGGWASSQQTSVWPTASWQQNDWASAKTEVDGVNWGQQSDQWLPRPRKWQCQFTIGIEEEPTFRVVRRLLGPGGKNVKAIAEETGAKLRLRGVGSKFLEGPEKKEATDPLMLCVSASSDCGYNTAVHMLQEILMRIYAEYQEFQSNSGVCMSPLDIQMHVGAREYF